LTSTVYSSPSAPIPEPTLSKTSSKSIQQTAPSRCKSPQPLPTSRAYLPQVMSWTASTVKQLPQRVWGLKQLSTWKTTSPQTPLLPIVPNSLRKDHNVNYRCNGSGCPRESHRL